MEVGDYIFCLLYFKDENGWKLGKPFLKKYQFSFNYDGKYIKFYKQTKNDEKDKGIPLYILIISVVGTIFIVALIAFLLFKFYFYNKCTRKKRANELTDDDFEYTSKGDEQKNNDEKDKLGLDIN